MNKEKELEQLYKQHADEIYRFCFFRTRDKEESEDFVTETYIRLFSQDSFNNIENKRAWLFKTARNMIYDQSRKQKTSPELSSSVEEEINLALSTGFEKEVIDTETVKMLEEKVRKMDEDTGDIIIMRLWDELTFEDISNILNESVTAVKKRFYRGIESLKLSLSREEKSLKFKSITIPFILAGILGVSAQPAYAFTAASFATVASAVGSTLGFTFTNMINSNLTSTAATAGTGLLATTAAKLIAGSAIVIAGAGVGIGAVAIQSNQPEQVQNEVPEETLKADPATGEPVNANLKEYQKYTLKIEYDETLWTQTEDQIFRHNTNKCISNINFKVYSPESVTGPILKRLELFDVPNLSTELSAHQYIVPGVDAMTLDYYGIGQPYAILFVDKDDAFMYQFNVWTFAPEGSSLQSDFDLAEKCNTENSVQADVQSLLNGIEFIRISENNENDNLVYGNIPEITVLPYENNYTAAITDFYNHISAGKLDEAYKLSSQKLSLGQFKSLYKDTNNVWTIITKDLGNNSYRANVTLNDSGNLQSYNVTLNMIQDNNGTYRIGSSSSVPYSGKYYLDCSYNENIGDEVCFTRDIETGDVIFMSGIPYTYIYALIKGKTEGNNQYLYNSFADAGNVADSYFALDLDTNQLEYIGSFSSFYGTIANDGALGKGEASECNANLEDINTFYTDCMNKYKDRPWYNEMIEYIKAVEKYK